MKENCFYYIPETDEIVEYIAQNFFFIRYTSIIGDNYYMGPTKSWILLN